MKDKKIIAVVLFLLVLAIPVHSFAQFLQPWQTAVIGADIGQKVTDSLFDIAAWTIGKVISIILFVVGFVGNILLNLGSEFVKFMFQLNNSVMDMDIVNIGWKLTRDLANLGFVLAIVIIGFATIVRYEKYGAKALLPRLIAAAILINFSLAIAGVFLDFSSVLTNFFIDHASNGTTASMMDNITNSFGVQKFFNVSTTTITKVNIEAPSALENLGTSALMNIASLFFTTTFTLLAALTFLGMGLMLAARFVYIAVLLILAPIAWLFWVIPQLQGKFGEWWHSFLKWTFFPPILAFFLYLTIISQNGLSSFEDSALGPNTGGTFISNFTKTASNMLIVIALLVGGLITAQDMGMTGASGMLGIAKGAKNKLQGWAAGAAIGGAAGVGSIGARLGRSALTLGTDAKGKTWLERQSAKLSGGNTAFSRFAKPFLGAPLTGLSGLSAKAKAFKARGVEDAQKRYDTRTGEDVANDMNRKVTQGFLMRDEDLAAAGIRVAKEGKWENLNDAVKNQVIGAVRRTGSKDKILGYIPHLADEFGETVEKAMMKYVQDATKFPTEMLGEADANGNRLKDIAINLRPSHVTQLANTGTTEQKNAVVGAVKEVLGQADLAQIDTLLQAMENAKTSIVPGALATAKNNMKTFVNNLATEDKKKAFAVYQNTQTNVNWG